MIDYEGKIIITSRIRLARNIVGYNYPHMLSEKKAEEVLNMVFNAADNIGNFNNYKLRNVKDEILFEYMEDNLITKELVANKNKSGVSISSDNSVSIMVNEEDHLRQQCTLEGLSLKKAYDIINDVDNELSESIKFGYHDKFGYLTACPTNVGTGLRASVVLFLPALTLTKNIHQVINTVSKLGISVRGKQGEGSLADGYLFQISNQGTLGKSEIEIIQMVENTVLKICDLENQAREQLLKLNETQLKDDIYRAFGVLSNCYSITSQESLELLSKVKLGVGLGIITLKEPQIIDDLLNNISAVKIKKLSNAELSDSARDIFRAEYLNRVLKNSKI